MWNMHMKSTATKCPCRKAVLQKTGRRWNPMNCSVLRAGLLAALCGLSASSTLAAFWDIQQSPWNGGKNHFCGDTLIASGTLNNSGAMVANFSTLPANTGPIEDWGGSRSGDYWYGVGVMANGDTGTTINNDSSGTMQGIITGSGTAQAAGILAQQNITINNSGICDGQMPNNSGSADGVCAKAAATVYNNAGATCSATANYATGIKGNGGRLKVVNNGTIKATAIGGTQGNSAIHSHAGGVDLFSFDANHAAPISCENNGSIIATAISTGCDTNNARAVNIWAEGSSATFKNTGTLLATATGPHGTADGIYCGADNGDVSFNNSGTISDSGSGGFCVGLENDSDTGNIYIDNSGTITTQNPFAIMLGNYKNDLKTCGHCYFKNTGTIKGGWLGLSWPAIGGMTFYDSGDIHTVLCWLGGNVDATICGLPTIDPELSADTSGHHNTLVFNLNGRLEQINGKTTSDTSFSGLPSQGSIVVSGKTYKWKNFNSVSGTAFPGNKATGTVTQDRRKRQAGAMLLPGKGSIRFYSMNGRFLGTFTGLDNGKKALPYGLYLVGSEAGKAVKLLNR